MKKKIIIAAFIAFVQFAFAGNNGRVGHDSRQENVYRPLARQGNERTYSHPQYFKPVLHVRSVCPAPVPVCVPVPMTSRDFAGLHQTIYHASFESTKLSIFRQAMAYNYFTTAQVLELMDLFYFDSSRLDIAKMAYPKTVDPQRYYLVNNAFTFSSSARELNQYLAMR
ncbi:MAG: DUF4476 domain-containing protein [Bacteroidetes bacterium]|nr:DUF4476 domain-containing protein [Bacteroidota bacterium]